MTNGLYQIPFSGNRAPPIALNRLAHNLSAFCILEANLLDVVVGGVVHKLTSSMNLNPIRLHRCTDIVQITRDKKPSSMRIWKSRELTNAQILGPVPLPWPVPVIGFLTVAILGI